MDVACKSKAVAGVSLANCPVDCLARLAYIGSHCATGDSWLGSDAVGSVGTVAVAGWEAYYKSPTRYTHSNGADTISPVKAYVELPVGSRISGVLLVVVASADG